MDLDAIRAASRRQTNLSTADISDADLLTIVNEGLREVATIHRWEWLFKSGTLTTVADAAEIALPADFMFMGLLTIDGKNNEPLQNISFSEYKYWYGDNASTASDGTLFYIRYDDGTGKIGIFPTPSTSTTDKYDIFYYRTPTELSTGTDVPEFDARFHSMLVDYASYRLWEREEYFDEAEKAFQRYGRRLREMMVFYNTRYKERRFIFGDGTRNRRFDVRRRFGWL